MLNIEEIYKAKTLRSRELYSKAKKVIPGGVTHNIRFYKPYPIFIEKAKGSKLYDVDGNQYVDFWNGHGSTWILGHAYPDVVEAVQEQVAKSSHYGTCHELESDLAEQIIKMVPNADMVKFSNSGTEANMYATRLAKTYTKRSKIGKFEGGWHGGYDNLYIAVDPPFNKPACGGLSKTVWDETVVLPYNDIEGVRQRIKEHKGDLACIIIEPVQGHGGCISAEKDFLLELRELCDEIGALLIFDEVITGFRLGKGGGQEHFNIDTDLAIFGKILGGGHPIGAFTGKRDIMEHTDLHMFSGSERAYIGGTFCGNPVTMIAGLTTLKILESRNVYSHINRLGGYLTKKLNETFVRLKVDIQAIGCKSLFGTHFTRKKLRNFMDIYQANQEHLLNYHTYLISQGYYFLPGHIGCISYTHTKEEINGLINATEQYLKELK